MAGLTIPKPDHEVQDTGPWAFFEDLFQSRSGLDLPIDLGFYKFQITKFMILELVAAALILLIYIPLARSIAAGGLPTGRWWNLFEGVLTFIRDQVARPNLDYAPRAHGHEPRPARAIGRAGPDPPRSRRTSSTTRPTSTCRSCGRCSCSSCSATCSA